MKQFAQCANCRQWYRRDVVTTVELIHDTGLQGIALWCPLCIQDAEQRSGGLGADDVGTAFAEMAEHVFQTPLPDASPRLDGPLPETEPENDFERLVLEHFSLQDRALQEDDDVLVPLITEFVARCGAYQAQLESPQQIQRLSGHLQYWEMFLKALHNTP